VAAQWERVREAPERWSPDWCLAAAAGLGRVQLSLGQYADELCREVQVGGGVAKVWLGLSVALVWFGEEVRVGGRDGAALDRLARELRSSGRWD